MTATSSEAVFRGVGFLPGVAVPRSESGVHVDGGIRPWQWTTVLTDSIGLLALIWSIPLAMALVGTPIAAAIALVLWLYRLAFSAV
jgi:hypothetical protein